MTKKNQTGTLGKAMDTLEAIASANTPPRFTDLLDICKQPRGTLHRQVSHLLEEDLIKQNANGSYSLGFRLLELAGKAWANNSEREIASPFLHELRQKTNATVHLAVLRDDVITYLDKVESNEAIRMHSLIGNVSPVYCTGVGKAMLSTLSDTELDELLPRLEYKKFTDNTITNAKALREELHKIRTLRYAEDREEHEPGIYCVAAPVVSSAGKLICGISVTNAVFRIDDQQLDNWRLLVVETAAAIGRSMSVNLGPGV